MAQRCRIVHGFFMGQWVKMIASILGSFFKLQKGIQKFYHIIIEVIPTIRDLSLDPPSIFGSLHRTVQPDRPAPRLVTLLVKSTCLRRSFALHLLATCESHDLMNLLYAVVAALSCLIEKIEKLTKDLVVDVFFHSPPLVLVINFQSI